MTRFAVFSDIHGNLPALKACHADALAQGCDTFLNLGDILSGPLWPAETAEWLMQRDWPTIAGNHERQVLTLSHERMGKTDRLTRSLLGEAHLCWIDSLPETLALPGLFLCHGTPESDITHFLFDVDDGRLVEAREGEITARLGNVDAPLTLCGHTHVARSVMLADGRRVANAGSVGLQAYSDDHPEPYIVENGDPLARYLVVEHGRVDVRSVAYDCRAAADRAAALGRPDWAHALMTGQLPLTR